VSKAKPDERMGHVSEPTSDGSGGPQAPERPLSPSNQTRPYYKALAQRIVDVYSSFTCEEMEMVEALGWGLAKPNSAT